MKKHLIISLIVVAILAGVHVSYAEMLASFPGRAGCGMRGEDMPPMPEMHRPAMAMMEGMAPGPRMWRNLMSLGLDEKQKEEMEGIKSKAIKNAIRKEADLRIAGIELKATLDKDPVNIKEVETKLKQIESVRTDLLLTHIKAMEEMKGKLTSAQRKEFRETMEMMPMMGDKGRMERKMYGGMRMPPPPYGETEEDMPPIEPMCQ